MRWFATALAFAGALALSACDGGSTLGPASAGPDPAEMSGLTVVPDPGAGSELRLPPRAGGRGMGSGAGLGEEPARDDDRGSLPGVRARR
ncbi:MAG: hypothetical protein R3266_04745 [Gemmatimonadota bacterium]|nr:hypothetical protein [Gemmatimonadota bacterium]